MTHRRARRGQDAQLVLGTSEADNKFTWIVNFQDGDAGSCNGVLIAPTWVLTAAYCMGPFFNRIRPWTLADVSRCLGDVTLFV